MSSQILSQIAESLSTENNETDHTEKPRKCYFAEETLPSAEIHVEVDEVGHLAFPLDKGNVQKLIGVASKSRFGFREQTISDESFRNSYEIPKEKLHVNIDNESYTRLLQKMSQFLGLTSEAELSAHLYNMLIYPPGHFFKMHQDTEKLPNMVATLVIVLPSPHIGGNLVIHLDEKHVFSTENVDDTDAKCIGFYADCFHEVEEVRKGFRVALTYNLVLESSTINVAQEVNENLKLAIKSYFDEHINDPEALLTIVLDHSYTEVGLRWDMLKGQDRCNASALRAVARELNLLPYLCSVEINETWDWELHDWGWGRRRNRWDSEQEEPEGEALELLDSSVSLTKWLDSKNKVLAFKEKTIHENQVCMRIENEAFKPFKSENSGYTGNEGCTQEYWYKRAGIVLYPKANEIKMNFLLDNNNALRKLCQISRDPQNKSKALKFIEKAGPYIFINCSQGEKEGFDLLAEVSVNLNEKEKASILMENFQWSVLKSDVMDSLISLQNQYGASFCIELLRRWEARSSSCLLNNILTFTETFLEKGGDVGIAHAVLSSHSNAIAAVNDGSSNWSYARILKKELPARLEQLEDVLKTCARINNVQVLQSMIVHVMQNPERYPILELSETFLKYKKEANVNQIVHLDVLRNYLFQAIESEFRSGQKSKDDWSVETSELKKRCSCENCLVLLAFLQSKTEQVKNWPIKEQIRNHIINKITGLDLPLSYDILRSGSPHKLLLTKKPSMHQASQERFRKVESIYKEL